MILWPRDLSSSTRSVLKPDSIETCACEEIVSLCDLLQTLVSAAELDPAGRFLELT